MKKLSFQLSFFLVVFCGIFTNIHAQTALNAGDIAIIWAQGDTPDNFAFVTFVDMDAGTVIYFTDCGADSSGFNTPCIEGAFSYTVPVGGLTAGDIILFSGSSSDFGVYTDSRITGSFAISTTGDQIIAFQDASSAGGSTNAGNNPQFIFAANLASTLFTGNKSDNNETGLPLGLDDTTSPRTALGLGAGPLADEEQDNAVYGGSYDFSGSGISGAKLALTDPANYTFGDAITEPAYDAAVNAIPSSLTLTSTCASTDTTPPVPDVANLPDITAQCEVTSLTPPTATDNCGGTVIVTSDAVLPITAQGTTVVTWTYDDQNGNTETQTQNVIINDTTDPVPDVANLPDVTAQCEVTSLTPPTATDNCGGTVIVTNNATLPITSQGTTVVTWTYDDGNGNTTTQNQNVIVNDTTDPIPDLANLPDINAECQVTSLTAPTGTDNCGGTVIVTNDATLPITAQGTTVVTWTYDDGNGNTTTQTQNVVINDTTDPVPDVATLPDVNSVCAVTSLTPPTATDNCGGTVIVTNDATLPITAQGTTVVTWTYDDGNGNTTTQAQNVVINDTTDPVPDVATLPDITAQCEVTSLTPPTATDNCGGTVIVTNNATLPITTQGTTVVTWTYDDGNGNTVTQNQNIVINDTTDPVPDVANLPDVTAQCAVTSLTPPTATDNCGGTVIVTNNATLPINVQGTTVVTWTYDDGNGNTTTQNQNVVINDTTDPVPDVATLPDVTAQCAVTSLTPPTATDNCGGTVIVTNNATLPINVQGTTVVTWTYDDGNGNTTTQNQNVVINDTTDPVPDVATLPDVTAQCAVTSLTPPTATDNCGGTVIVTNDATLPITAQGTTVVTWTYDDGNGNTTTQAQNIVINDTTDPVPDVATLPDVNSVCAVTSLTAPTGTDNCGGTVIVTNDATLPITAQGTTVVTWTYDDGNGNTTTQTQNVVINDTTDPVPDVANLPDVTAQCEVTSLTPPTANDNCGGTVIVTNDATLPITAQGTTVVTWTYDDGNGNTTTQTQNVVIN
uniref:beta strand repeat-containing protein n=1 Tax=Ascidiimonas aurantiaca TaxID=1685432 RepID=UPI003BB669F3